MKNLIRLITLFMLVLTLFKTAYAGTCPDYLNHPLKKLHSSQTVNICQQYAGKPLLIVNTASFCGYTPQFSGLEKLHQQYKDKGLVILGFASNDFNQEATSDQEIAKVCQVNYGVTFDMFSPIHVKGKKAHPLFTELAAQTSEPQWNFNKYLINSMGKVVQYFGSEVEPQSEQMQQAIMKILP